MRKKSELAGALQIFIEAIEATGGVFKDRKGYFVPVADEDWIDLGEAYVEACHALDEPPKIKED